MPRLFVSNFDFEDALVDSSPARRGTRIPPTMHSVWNALAQDDDAVLSVGPAPHLPNDGGNAGRASPPIVDRVDLPRFRSGEWQVVPWGWTDAIRSLGESGFHVAAPSHASVCLGNRREFSVECENRLCPDQDWVWPINSVDEFVRMTRNPAVAHGWIVKPAYSFAGRSCLRGRSVATEQQMNWIHKRMRQTALFFERQLVPIEESGLQFEIPRSGPISFLGRVSNRVSPSGTWLAAALHAEARDPQHPFNSEWQVAIEHGLAVAAQLRQAGYFGPLGIDAMRFTDRNSVRLRSLQDINARYTMGRFALEWQTQMAAGQSALWWHARHTQAQMSSSDVASFVEQQLPRVRVIPTAAREASATTERVLDLFLLTGTAGDMPSTDELQSVFPFRKEKRPPPNRTPQS